MELIYSSCSALWASELAVVASLGEGKRVATRARLLWREKENQSRGTRLFRIFGADGAASALLAPPPSLPLPLPGIRRCASRNNL